MLMKNVLKLIFSSLLMFPFTMNAQQQDFRQEPLPMNITSMELIIPV